MVSHIPPTDPRNKTENNPYPNIPKLHNTDFFEREMNNYLLFKNLNHSFPDKQEAKRFEDLMTNYKVDTVFLSHIHSYFSFIKGGVRYIISGGAGAELLTPNSYYHYLRVKVTDKDVLPEIILLPSPTNQIQDRILFAIQLFASSIYKEYSTWVIGIALISLTILGFALWKTRLKWIPYLKFIFLWLYEVIKFAITKYKENKPAK